MTFAPIKGKMQEQAAERLAASGARPPAWAVAFLLFARSRPVAGEFQVADTIAGIAEACGLHRNTAGRALGELERLGVIGCDVTAGGGRLIRLLDESGGGAEPVQGRARDALKGCTDARKECTAAEGDALHECTDALQKCIDAPHECTDALHECSADSAHALHECTDALQKCTDAPHECTDALQKCMPRDRNARRFGFGFYFAPPAQAQEAQAQPDRQRSEQPGDQPQLRVEIAAAIAEIAGRARSGVSPELGRRVLRDVRREVEAEVEAGWADPIPAIELIRAAVNVARQRTELRGQQPTRVAQFVAGVATTGCRDRQLPERYRIDQRPPWERDRSEQRRRSLAYARQQAEGGPAS